MTINDELLTKAVRELLDASPEVKAARGSELMRAFRPNPVLVKFVGDITSAGMAAAASLPIDDDEIRLTSLTMAFLLNGFLLGYAYRDQELVQ